MAQKPSRRQPTAAQLMDRKQHELYFQQMREREHRKKLERVHQLEVMWEAEDRVQQKRVTRLLREEEHEQRLEEAVQQAEENKKLKALELQQEEKLATELARLNHNKLKDEKMRQQIKENSIELRELERKLQSAYMNKERAVQIAEKEALKYEKMSSLVVIRSCGHKEQWDFWKIDVWARQDRLEKKRTTQKFIEEFQKDQALRRRRQHEEMEEENRKIMEFANMWQEREDNRMAKIHENEEKKRKLQQMLADVLKKEQQEREELEQIRAELHFEEQAETERKEEMEELEKRIRQRLELRNSYEEQLALRKMLLQDLKEEEEAFAQATLAKFAEDDRIEQMNAQKRRMKQLEHRREVEKLIQERRKQVIADRESELEERQIEERRRGIVADIIEEERQKLLKEHAVKLLGYLPRGILKDEQDVNMLGEEFRQAYQKRPEVGPSEVN
ncbi:hypothetical protein Chor_014610 [Crotalus horridus]